MSQEQPKEEFISVNQVLNLKPRLGPVPGEQVIPWSIIFLLSYISWFADKKESSQQLASQGEIDINRAAQ